ncbi:hypothetical protein EKD04_019185 [Chloroflexales bacterium ZM16-3]|nr:hypothetical protein [Chloroflexales bacterium ZM16-3]
MQKDHRTLNAISRILFAIWMLDEARSFKKRRDPEGAPQSPQSLALLLALVPMAWPLRLPRPLRIAGLIIQAIALIIMLGARWQLIAANSFGWSANAATEPQQSGFYRYLEHPIYGAGLLHVIGLGAANPIAWLVPVLGVRDSATLISNERRFLAKLGVTHRGVDSFYWDFVITAIGQDAVAGPQA